MGETTNKKGEMREKKKEEENTAEKRRVTKEITGNERGRKRSEGESE